MSAPSGGGKEGSGAQGPTPPYATDCFLLWIKSPKGKFCIVTGWVMANHVPSISPLLQE
jgi:hypothetical protein